MHGGSQSLHAAVKVTFLECKYLDPNKLFCNFGNVADVNEGNVMMPGHFLTHMQNTLMTRNEKEYSVYLQTNYC